MFILKPASAATLSCGILFFALYLQLPVSVAFPSEVITLLYLPVVGLSIYVFVRKRSLLPVFLQTTGIPLGIFVSIFLFVVDLQNVSNKENLVDAAARAFMAIFHGGLVTSIGHLISTQTEKVTEEFQRSDRLVLILFALFLPLYCSLVTDASIMIFWSLEAFLILAAPLPLLLSRVIVSALYPLALRCLVMGMLGATLVSIVGYLATFQDSSDLGVAMAVGMLGLLYGSHGILIVGWMMTASYENLKALTRASWHGLEIFSLLMLLIYAPPSLIELLETIMTT